MNISLHSNLVQLLMPTPGATTASVVATEPGQPPPAGFDELLQMLSKTQPPTESALPELMAVVASLAGSSNLPEGIEKSAGLATIAKDWAQLGVAPQTCPKLAPQDLLQMLSQTQAPTESALPELMAEVPKEKKPQRASESPVEINPVAALWAQLGVAPQLCPKLAPKEQSDMALGAEGPAPDVEIEIPKPDAPPRPVLNLRDFDVRRFEFKTEVETPAVQPKLIRVVPLPVLIHPPVKPQATEPKPVKGFTEVVDSPPPVPSVFEEKHEAPPIEAPAPVQRVQVAIDPPPPPPVARQISMDIGDPESQVRVVIRERNGDLAVQFGAATERLRENLQNASPLLLHELQRDSAHNTISLDFSRFGSATEGGQESHHQEARRKKPLKPEAVFADVDEMAYLSDGTPSAKSF